MQKMAYTAYTTSRVAGGFCITAAQKAIKWGPISTTVMLVAGMARPPRGRQVFASNVPRPMSGEESWPRRCRGTCLRGALFGLARAHPDLPFVSSPPQHTPLHCPCCVAAASLASRPRLGSLCSSHRGGRLRLPLRLQLPPSRSPRFSEPCLLFAFHLLFFAQRNALRPPPSALRPLCSCPSCCPPSPVHRLSSIPNTFELPPPSSSPTESLLFGFCLAVF